MARPKYQLEKDADKPRKRVPVRLDTESQDKLREMALVWFRRPIEWLAGDWLAERIEAEYRKGRKK